MSADYLNIYEIKAKFSSYARQVMKGKSFLIAFRNRPFAELRPIPENKTQKTRPRKLTFGILKDSFVVPDNFNDALIEFENDFYGDK